MCVLVFSEHTLDCLRIQGSLADKMSGSQEET